MKSTASLIESAWEASKKRPSASPPSFLILDAASLAASTLKSAITTFAPSLANRVAADKPIPEAPPVTNATLP
ncbi:hypothetical protein D3C81_2036060 [compost metagenome]